MRSPLLALAPAALACALAPAAHPLVPAAAAGPAREAAHHGSSRTRPVAGRGVDLLTTAIVHSEETTPTGKVVRSTEIVELEGDLSGRVLYQPTSVFDFVKGTLVNTGHQVFSGTVLGSAPVMIYDDRFRFEVDLQTGAERGEVHLTDTLAGPRVRCHLRVEGTGLTPEGNPTFDYAGECEFKDK